MRSAQRRLPEGSGLLTVPAAALLVHQLRYSLGYGSRASSELAAQGHAYLHSSLPWLILALGIGLTLFLRRVAAAVATGRPGRSSRLSALALWGTTTAGLLAIYVVQELLEGFFAAGHPGGLGGVFGHGGFWAVPAAAVVSVGIVLLLRTARFVLRFAAAVGRRRRWSRPTTPAPYAARFAPRLGPLAAAAAGRAPPRSLPNR
jgi:hypothetical protein